MRNLASALLPWLPGDDGGADGTSTEQPVVTDGAGGKTSGLERAEGETDALDDDTLGGRDSTDEEIDISAVALLDTLPRPGFIVDTSHCIVGWNEELEELTGVDRESVLGGTEETVVDDDGTVTAAAERVDHADTV